MNTNTTSKLISLVESHKDELTGFCERKGADDSLAEELVQELRYRILSDETGSFADRLLQQKDILACFKAICRHALLDLYRRRKCFQKYRALEAAESAVRKSPQPDEILMEKEKRLQMEKGLESMPPRVSMIIFLKLRRGLTFREIAAISHRDVNSVAAEYYRGVHGLKVALQDLREEYKI